VGLKGVLGQKRANPFGGFGALWKTGLLKGPKFFSPQSFLALVLIPLWGNPLKFPLGENWAVLSVRGFPGAKTAGVFPGDKEPSGGNAP